MEHLIFEKDVTVYCVKAERFPDGVLKAHQSLHTLTTFDTKRHYYGISFPNKDGIIQYMAAAEELEVGEYSQHSLPIYTLPKGRYVFKDVLNFMETPEKLSEVFKALIALPDIDPNGFCLEWYINQNTCRCLVKLK